MRLISGLREVTCMLIMLLVITLNGEKIPKETIEACLQECQKDDADFERMRQGQYRCRQLPDEEPDIIDPCVRDCFKDVTDVSNQTECFCNHGKHEPGNHIDFCIEAEKNLPIAENECDSMVCTGEAKYYGKFCTETLVDVKAEMEELKRTNDSYSYDIEEIVTTIFKDKIDACMQSCKAEDAHYERMKQGLFECIEGSTHPVVKDPCEGLCYNQFVQLEDPVNQTDCFCRFCKESRYGYKSFCTEIGKDKHIDKSQCDDMVCSGKTTYYGMYCKDEESTALAIRECYKKCRKTDRERLEKGLYRCLYDGEEVVVTDPCRMECNERLKEKVARVEDQTECLCTLCKQTKKAYKNFCIEPGNGNKTHIQQSECDELVCTGKAKYYGKLCGKEKQDI